MKETPIICLASWYPNELEEFEGDFVQRKMQALSLYRNVHVFHFKKHENATIGNKRIVNKKENLTETIAYHHSGKANFLKSIKNYLVSFQLHNKFLKNHRKQFGKPETILVQVPYNAGIIAWYWKKRYGIKYILTEHYGIYNDRYESNFATRSSLYKFIVRQIFKNASQLLTVSNSLGEDINNTVVQKGFKKLSNVVDTNQFFYKKKPPIRPFVFCHLSNMIPVKNIPGIIRACKILIETRKDFRLNLIGAKHHEHINLAEELGLLNYTIFFQDAITYKEVAKTLQNSHALIMFSNTESQSCISLEALCTGTPVISSRAGGIEEHLDDTNSIMVPIGNEEELANAMLAMMENYDNFQQEEIALANQARWNFLEIGKQYNDIIENVLSQ